MDGANEWGAENNREEQDMGVGRKAWKQESDSQWLCEQA